MAKAPAYTEKQLATAINDLMELLSEEQRNEMFEKHYCCEEIWMCGPDGPTGRGLGKYGGHAIGDDEIP
jgi:hypothetical protein